MAHPYILWELSFKLDNVENKNTFFGISSYQKIEDRTCDPLFAKPCWIWRGCSYKKIVFRICLLSLLLLQTPETYARSNMNFSRADQYKYEKEKKRELEEIHCTSSIYIYMEEFVYWQYLRCKLQKRPVPVQTWIFQEQTYLLSVGPTVIKLDFHHPRKKKERKANLMIIAFITSNSSLVPVLEGLCSSNPYRFVTERAYGPLVPYLPACGGTSTIGRYVPWTS